MLNIYFDKQDHALLDMVNQIIEASDVASVQEYLFDSALHPHGIKELVATREMRIAVAVMDLLHSLESKAAPDRLQALQLLYDEVISVAGSTFRFNTGRVLVQIMKDLIRAHGNPEQQLNFAHTFRKAARGNRRYIRHLLQKYFLLEMPETWNQLTFDNRVHDAHTKGRKTPTHLIMDAWIKGIRSLTVVYYNFIDFSAVHELLQAAKIMGIETRIGIEYRAIFQNKYVPLIWIPFDRSSPDMLAEFAIFLQRPAVQELMEEGRKASAYYGRNVRLTLEKYNGEYRHALSRHFHVDLPTITEEAFTRFVGSGQASLTHLAEMAHKDLRTQHATYCQTLREGAQQDHDTQSQLCAQQEKMRGMFPETLLERWIKPVQVAGIMNPNLPDIHNAVPALLRVQSKDLLQRLHDITRKGSVTLEVSGLESADVLELLYENRGRITHLELFNLKSDAAGKNEHIAAISALQFAINQKSPILLKRLVEKLVYAYQEKSDTANIDRSRSLLAILYDIERFQSFYAQYPLRTTIGSDSTSRLDRSHGMGFVWLESLPVHIQKNIIHFLAVRKILPLQANLEVVDTWKLEGQGRKALPVMSAIKKNLGVRLGGYKRTREWRVQDTSLRYSQTGGTIATLGGLNQEMYSDEINPKESQPPVRLNTTFANWLKVILGFVLTLATFAFTQEWWVLVWFSAPIWFGITGIRNIIQAVLAGRGFTRNSLLHWKDYVDWSRLSDSLMYTGFSVPLLELVVRWWLLRDLLGVDAVSQPLLFFSVVSSVNGVYIAFHNWLRGLQKEAIIGNLFRSILAIPLAMAYNGALNQLVVGFSFTLLTPLVTDGAAIISKMASDTVAGLIEGVADRRSNLQMRYWGYTRKVRQFFSCYTRLELLLPEENIPVFLQDTKRAFTPQGDGTAAISLVEKKLLIHSLDLMYFYMYQPQGAAALKGALAALRDEERVIFVEAQSILKRKKAVSQLFVDGVVGMQFSRALSFYLNSHHSYLVALQKISKQL